MLNHRKIFQLGGCRKEVASISIAIVCNTFYPNPTVSSIRVTSFAKTLVNSGYKVKIIHRYSYPYSKEDIEVMFGGEIYITSLEKGRVKEGRRGSSLKTKFNNLINKFFGNFLVPDLSASFWKRNKASIIEEIGSSDILITSSPAHSIHHIGLIYKRLFPSKVWISDFRDPYLIDSRFCPRGLGKLLFFYHKRYLSNIYELSDKIIHAIPIENRWAKLNFNQYRGKFHLIKNGAHESLVEKLARVRKRNISNRALVVSSVGYCPTEEATILCRTIEKLFEQGINVKLNIVGDIPSVLREKFSHRKNLINFIGKVSHDKALDYIAESDINISLLSESRSCCLGLSSKLFEYAYTGSFIISVNPTKSDFLFLNDVENSFCLKKPDENRLLEVLNCFIDSLMVERKINSCYPKYLRVEENLKLLSVIQSLKYDRLGQL